MRTPGQHIQSHNINIQAPHESQNPDLFWACRGGGGGNFTDPDVDDWRHAYHGSNHARLAEVKRRYDPDRVFRFPHSL